MTRPLQGPHKAQQEEPLSLSCRGHGLTVPRMEAPLQVIKSAMAHKSGAAILVHDPDPGISLRVH